MAIQQGQKGQIDEGRVLATAKADIKWADDYYRDHIEQDLIRRYEVYQSDTDRYKRLYPDLSRVNEMRTFDLWSAVEWLLPNMLKAFFGADRIISISGVGSEDADRAEKVMKLIQWQLTVKNQGYRIFKGWFGDALATNLGVLKCYWKRETETIPHQEEVDQQKLVGIMQDPNNQIVSVEPMPDIMSILGMQQPQSAMVSWQEERIITNQPVIEVIRPSDIRFTPDGRTLGECSMVAHRKVTTIDQLRREARRGIYDPQVVEEIAAEAGDDYELTELEKKLSDGAEDALQQATTSEKARARVIVYECYLKTDIDGDGLLEDAIVTVCDDRLLRAVENPYKRAPLFDIVPFWDSYQVWSRLGLAEVLQEMQDAHTALLRQMIIGLGISNKPVAVVDVTKINMDDLMNQAQFIRSSGALTESAFQQIQLAGLNSQNFQFFEYIKGQIEQWIGVTRYNQGMDASSLNKTATGINMIMTAAQQRQEEIMRNFAETGIRELFRFLIQLNQRYIDQPQVVRLQGGVMEISRDDLFGDFDLSVDASSGIGARDAKVQVLTSYLREMLPFAIQLGVAGPQQFVMAGQKLLKLMGIEDADKYLTLPQMMPGMMGMPGMPGMLGAGLPGGGGAQIAGPGAGAVGAASPIGGPEAGGIG
ncbi:MAG: hypothetical protein LBQ42_12520 [Synergistaceae bacterium]|jgi:hypothetical protein|nr:hypothetical protein [Synergistaceae bacterium]